MKQYNVLQAIFMSFYSKNLYRDVANNWGGKAFFYLLFLLCLSWIAFVCVLQMGINEGYRKHSDAVIDQIPVLTIKDGKLSTPENKPYVIVNPDTKEKVFVIDTTGQYTSLEQAQAPVLVTETQVFSQTKPNQIRIDQIPSNLSVAINPQTVNEYLKYYLGYAWIFLFILFVIISYVFRVLQSLIYALIGIIFKAIFKVSLTYGQLLVIAMVALTPVIVISTILDFLNVVLPYESLIGFLLSMAYLCFGIIANKAKS